MSAFGAQLGERTVPARTPDAGRRRGRVENLLNLGSEPRPGVALPCVVRMGQVVPADAAALEGMVLASVHHFGCEMPGARIIVAPVRRRSLGASPPLSPWATARLSSFLRPIGDPRSLNLCCRSPTCLLAVFTSRWDLASRAGEAPVRVARQCMQSLELPRGEACQEHELVLRLAARALRAAALAHHAALAPLTGQCFERGVLCATLHVGFPAWSP